MSVEAIASKWHDQLLSIEPVDHASAKAAVREAYQAAKLPAPERFLWCSSPLEAVWGALVIIGKGDGYNHAVLEDIERLKTGPAKLATARAMVAEQLGIGENEIEGHFGQPFYRAEGFNPVSKQLMEDGISTWMARAEAGDDFLAPHGGGPFKPLHDLEQSLHFEGYRFRNGEQEGSLYNQALAKAGGKQVAILGGRSAHHRLYGNFAYGEIALDEALADAGKLQPTELQRAMWAAYQACGMWWPLENGVVFAERPTSVDGSGDGLRMEWADGFVVGAGAGAGAGKAESKPATPARTTVSAPVAVGPAILSAPLPRDHAVRIAELRKAGAPMPLFDRYVAGEQEQVWKELVALGEAVRSEAHAADALAVAYETMDRVRRNVEIIAERLRASGYRFVQPGSGGGLLGGLFGAGKASSHKPLVPPGRDSAALIAQLEAELGGPIPLSLRAFFEVVGEVNLNGEHDAIAPSDSAVATDPLMVCGVEEAIGCLGSFDDDEQEMIAIAPDALHKANVSGSDPYMISVPAAVADAPLEAEPHEVNFVEYLRIAIGWGGFPGWENAKATPPKELEELRRDRIAF